jgi:hypothetical protein
MILALSVSWVSYQLVVGQRKMKFLEIDPLLAGFLSLDDEEWGRSHRIWMTSKLGQNDN